MNTSLDQLQEWMDSKESERLEFKEAKQNFHFGNLVKKQPIGTDFFVVRILYHVKKNSYN